MNGTKIKTIGCINLYKYLNNDAELQTGKAIFPDSLLSDYLIKNNLITIKGNSTKDLLIVNFDYSIKGIKTKDNYRKELYKDGFSITWNESLTIRYKMFFRTTSKAKSGSVMFINADSYDKAYKWLSMGLTERIKPNEPFKLVELGAYQSLVASHIEDTIRIKPSEILILNDVESHFTKDVAVVKTDKDKHCVVENQNDYELTNTLFDGQALLDDSLFINHEEAGFLLLRNHFFKACGFRSYISKFMKDYCKDNGKDYNTYQIRDMFGHKRYVKNIKLITTNNAIKWLKFKNLFESENDLYDYWENIIKADDYIFGIVKTDHDSHYGKYQRLSYQMINSLPLDESEVDNLCKYEIQKVMSLKNDDKAFVQYLIDNQTDMNDYKLLVDLFNNGLGDISVVKNRRARIISDYVKSLRKGKIEVTGQNLTVVQNPYAMLLHSVHNLDVKNPKDECFNVEEDCIEVYTEHFEFNKNLIGFRNPHNSPNNVLYYKNVDNDLMHKYFKLGNNIIAINGICTDVQDRANSQDQDSDFELISDNPILVDEAENVYKNFPTIVNDIKPQSKEYDYSIDNLAEIDNALADSQQAIGESSNLAQIALSYYWNSNNEKYSKYFIILSVLAQIAIDSAKRTFDVDYKKEIFNFRMSKDFEGKYKYPMFFKYIDESKNDGKTHKADLIINGIQCPMNYLEDVFDNELQRGKKTSTYILEPQYDTAKVNDKQIKKIQEVEKGIDKLDEDCMQEIKKYYKKDKDYLAYYMLKRDCQQEIKKKKINDDTMLKIIADGNPSTMNLVYLSHQDVFIKLITNCPKTLKKYKKNSTDNSKNVDNTASNKQEIDTLIEENV